jgi:hypothetical protein
MRVAWTRYVPFDTTATKILGTRMQKCAGDDGEPDLKKATLLLEVYSVELQMCAAQRNFKRLKVRNIRRCQLVWLRTLQMHDQHCWRRGLYHRLGRLAGAV